MSASGSKLIGGSGKRKLAQQSKELDNQTELDDLKKSKMTISLWIFCILILVFGVGSIVFIVLGLQETSTQSGTVDVVLFEYQSPSGTVTTSRMTRHIAQANAVRKNMEWVNKIFVLSATQKGDDNILGVTFVTFSGNNEEAFMYMPKIPGIADYAVYLSDTTLPLRKIQKSYMFSFSNSRMFNVFRDHSDIDFFTPFMELPTMPVMVTQMTTLARSKTWKDLIFKEVTEENVVLHNAMNRDIMIRGNSQENAQSQFNSIKKTPPLFITIHVNESQSDSEKEQAHNLVTHFLKDLVL